jgi:hypothetical protein
VSEAVTTTDLAHGEPGRIAAVLLTAEQAVAALTVENGGLRAALRDLSATYHTKEHGRPGWGACAAEPCRGIRELISGGASEHEEAGA